ncbi:MAG: sporulation protein YqfD [Firmicutes bacterium]|nr:sporulation protein YqfD [Bacillota bacterium]
MGWYEFKAEGLSLERFLNQCSQQGIRLRRVRKQNARVVTGSVAAADLLALKTLAESRGWRLTVLGAHGMVRVRDLIRQRVVLAAGALVFLALCWGILSCVWFIDVRGAGPYTGEIQRILKEHDVRVGRLGFLLNLDNLKEDMQRQLTGLAWVGVSKNGVRLTVSCVQAERGHVTERAAGDLVAARDGVIYAMTVRAGTPAVKVGDAVRKGQVLVRGQERAWNGAVNAINADAGVEARVWYTADAMVSSVLVESKPTGDTYTRRTLCTPFCEYALEDPPEYETFDVVVDRLAIGGSFPVWLTLERYEAVVRHEISRDENEVREEAAVAAYRLAQEKIPYGVRVVDKWVEYSMIKDGRVRATAVLETIENITAVPR